MRPSLLCFANFCSNTGYAWDFIESLYARVADHLAESGIRTFVAYPEINEPPKSLDGSVAKPVELALSLDGRRSLQPVIEFIRRENVRVLYLTDQPAWSWAYLRLRWAGVRRIVVHDHVSSGYQRIRGAKRFLKYALMHTPGIVADRVITVSDYVASRQIESGMIPAAKVTRIWNGIAPFTGRNAVEVRELFSLPADAPLVMCACRAADYKGVHHLLRAFDQVVLNWRGETAPILLYVGGGPQLEELHRIRESLASKARITLAGFYPESRLLLAAADLCVIPSVWPEAFPLAVLEAMILGKPTIASRVGGIPELIEDNKCGFLVPPGDEAALATAISKLLNDRQLADSLGQSARERALDVFGLERQLDALREIFLKCFTS
jgi:glycosyltransferase involved in cell wall biosynthesis